MSYPGGGKADYLELGDYNAVCYECGRKFKASTLVRHWQGYYVCQAHFEIRQPQDFVRGIKDIQVPPWVQPMPDASYVAVCTPNGNTAISDFAMADCVIADYTSPMFDPDVTE